MYFRQKDAWSEGVLYITKEREEEDAVNRYLLNLKREIGLQIRFLRPTTRGEAQGYASETEMWNQESHHQIQYLEHLYVPHHNPHHRQTPEEHHLKYRIKI